MQELDLGVMLGKGAYCDVNEISAIVLKRRSECDANGNDADEREAFLPAPKRLTAYASTANGQTDESDFPVNLFDSKDELREYIDFIQGLGIRKIIVIGQFIHLREDLLIALPKAGTLRNLVTTYSDDRSFRHNAGVARICEEMGCLFVDKKALLCNDDGCMLEVDGIPFTWDRGHLTWRFATMIGRKAQPAILQYLDAP